jgi:hypothetical protein
MVIVRVGKFCALEVWTPMQAMASTATTEGNRMVIPLASTHIEPAASAVSGARGVRRIASFGGISVR